MNFSLRCHSELVARQAKNLYPFFEIFLLRLRLAIRWVATLNMRRIFAILQISHAFKLKNHLVFDIIRILLIFTCVKKYTKFLVIVLQNKALRNRVAFYIVEILGFVKKGGVF